MEKRDQITEVGRRKNRAEELALPAMRRACRGCDSWTEHLMRGRQEEVGLFEHMLVALHDVLNGQRVGDPELYILSSGHQQVSQPHNSVVGHTLSNPSYLTTPPYCSMSFA